MIWDADDFRKLGEGLQFQTYLWIEDRKGKASYTFWSVLLHELCPDVILESKKNSSELVKSVRTLQDQGNQYIIVFDNSFDNPQVCLEQKMLKRYAEEKHNVFLLDIICFEYLLLEFDRLVDWIYASDDEFLTRRRSAILARDMLVRTLQSGTMDYKMIQEITVYDTHLSEHNIEQLSAKLLYDLTRNTGFEVSKKNVGDCWVKSCCKWSKRQENDRCGLDDCRLSVAEKMRMIYIGTSLNRMFSKVGLEAIL